MSCKFLPKCQTVFVSNLETENLNKSNLKNKTPGSDQGAYLTDDFEWDHFTIKLKQIGHFALSQTGRADYFHLQKIQWFGYFLLASSFGLILLFDHHLVTNNLFLISTNWDKTILIICGSVLMSLY